MQTLGKTSAKLIQELYNKNKVIFGINDVKNITGLSYFSSGRLISELKKRKIIASLKKGKHIIIPQELGSIENYIGNSFIAAKNIVNSPKYYIAFYSAMDFWGMIIHPTNNILIASPKRQIAPIQLKDKFKFIFINKKFIFGIIEKWIDKKEKVRISDLEKTILDALFHPEYCGGITEIAKGIFLAKDEIDWKKILLYLKKYNKSIIIKRFGYISEILSIANKEILNNLKRKIGKQYDLFDPILPKKKLAKNNWRLIDNVSPEQIRKIIKT